MSNEQRTATLRELGRPHVEAWLHWRDVKTLKHGDAADLMERVGAAIEAEQVAHSRASVPAVPNHALVQLLESALLHPESAERNIRQVIEILDAAVSSSSPAEPPELQSLRDEVKRLHDHIADLNHDLEAAIKECYEQHG